MNANLPSRSWMIEWTHTDTQWPGTGYGFPLAGLLMQPTATPGDLRDTHCTVGRIDVEFSFPRFTTNTHSATQWPRTACKNGTNCIGGKPTVSLSPSDPLHFRSVPSLTIPQLLHARTDKEHKNVPFGQRGRAPK